ncbi:MAG: hypothetical protein VB091_04760 [Christensenella sp.]|nr:hypothetical protein [Christensenella sp.]
MRKSRFWIILFTLGAVIISFVFLLAFGRQNSAVHSNVAYTEDQSAEINETISDESVPMAAPATEETDVEIIPITNDLQPINEVGNTSYLANMQNQNDSSTPIPVEPVVNEPAPQNPETQQPAAPEPPTEEQTPPEEPETPATPGKAVKPSDIADVQAMAKYLFDAGTEFWAVEKDFCGTTTRPVSTRVASAIGGGTAVDCPGGDTVRIDKNGVTHDSYAIADHFREYVDMPDLQYFKLYLSDKDYTVNSYGAREEVVGSFYQYGSERATYEPEEEPQDERISDPS